MWILQTFLVIQQNSYHLIELGYMEKKTIIREKKKKVYQLVVMSKTVFTEDEFVLVSADVLNILLKNMQRG